MSRIKVDRITNRAGTGDPLFPNGISVVGLTSLSNVIAGVGTFSNVTIGGTITYDDVTNVDSTGIVTARSGVKVGDPSGIGVTIEPNGNAQFIGIVTASSFVGDLNASSLTSGTIPDARFPATLPAISGANLTNLPPGGNVIQAVANGSIANDKPVVIQTDGKVAEVKEAITNKTNPTSDASFNNGIGAYFYVNDANSSNAAINANRSACWVYDPDKDRVLVFWKMSGGTPFYCRVGTPNRTTNEVTFGNAIQVDNGNIKSPTAVYDTVRDKVVVMGFISNTLRAWVGTVASSGNTATFTSDYTCSNADANDGDNCVSAFDPTTGSTIIVYTDQSSGSSSSWGSRMQIGQVDGSGAFVWHTAMTSTNNYLSQDMFTSAPSKIEHHDIQSVGNSKWIYVLTIEGSPPSGFADKGIYAKIINAPTSNTTPTYANAGAKHIQTASAVNRGTYPVVAWDPNKEKLLFIYRANTGAGDPGTNDRHYALLCYFNAGKTDITINDAVYGMAGSHTETDSRYQLVYDSGTQRFAYTTNAAAGIVRGHFLTPSGTGNNTLSVSDGGATFATAGSDFGERSSHTLIDIGNGGGSIPALFSIYTSTALGASRYVIIPTKSIASNLTDGSHVIGFADQAYTDGQTATIKTYGNNVNTLTGLTAGTKYWVQVDGSLGTSAGNPAALAGLALSPTKLLIREPKDT